MSQGDPSQPDPSQVPPTGPAQGYPETPAHAASQPPQQGYQHPSQAPQAYGQQPQAQPKAAGGAAGAIGIVLALLAVPPLGLALHNLTQAQRLSVDRELPRFARAIVVDANMNRVLMFGGVALAIGLVALALGAVGRRSGAGKAAMGLAAVGLAASLYAQVGRATFDRDLPPGKQDVASEDEDSRRGEPREKKSRSGATASGGDAPPPSMEVADTPIKSPSQGAFRLGRQVALAALGRARGASEPAGRVFEKAQTTASELKVALAPLPTLTGDKTTDSADALHYLLDTVGKPVANTLKAKHGAEAAAAFELGIKLTLINLLYLPHDSLGQTLGKVCDELGGKAGLKSGTLQPLVSKIKANRETPVVVSAASDAARAIDQELSEQKPKPKQYAPQDLNRQLF